MAITAPTRAPMDATRKTALVAGLSYLITFAASLPAVFLLGPLLNNADYIVSARADTRVLWGCFLDVANALACIGTAVALFPVVKRQNEAVALGFVTTRMFEAAVILVGVVSLLAVVTLRRDLAGAPGADTASLVTTGRALVAVRDWTLTIALFRGNDPVTVLAAIATALIFLWELSVGVWFEEAAAVPMAAVTALQGLHHHGELQPAQQVLVNGATGGVGSFAVQLAKAYGPEVTTVTSTRNLDLARWLGADHVVDDTTTDFARSGRRYPFADIPAAIAYLEQGHARAKVVV